MAELDLTAIKTQYETEIAHQEYWGQDYGTLNKAQDMIEKLIAEVERLRGEVDSLKREVNYYEGKDWRSDGPIYPEVED